MSKYRGPRFRIIRRLFSPQMFCQFDQFTKPLLYYSYHLDNKKLFRPGQHSTKKTKNPTQFVIRLKEKQKLRTYYIISEKQLIQYMKEARKIKKSTSKVLIQLLERRLDMLFYRCSNMNTILEARQWLNHCHLFFNIKNFSNSFSFTNFVTVTEKELLLRIHRAMSIGLNIRILEPIEIDPHSSMNTRMTGYPRDINPRLVVEYYLNRL